MRYVPKQAPDDVNVSKEHPLVEAGTLVAGLSLIFIAIALILILMVDLVLMIVSPAKEAQLFSSWLPDDLVTVQGDDGRHAEVDELVQRLASHWKETPYEFRVEISDDSNLNAMAFPGGLIVVTSGLLDRVESENELAFILGHELGHFRNRDHIRGLGRVVLLSIFFAAISGSDGGANLGVSVGDLALRGFSRGQESDADEFGLGIVYEEYGHVAQATRFFERIEDDDAVLSELASYLSTHPSPDDRIERLAELSATRNWSLSEETVPINWDRYD
jgi:predicted Zn-dependent protease